MTDTPPPPPSSAAQGAQDKRRTLLELLDLDEGLVAVHLDARHPGVAVPPHLLGEPALRLDIAYGFNLPRLEIDDEGVEAVLSFGGRNFACFLPWDAIFSVSRPRHEGEGFVWPASLPPELRAPLGEAPAPRGEPADPPDSPADTRATTEGNLSIHSESMDNIPATPEGVAELLVASLRRAERELRAPSPERPTLAMVSALEGHDGPESPADAETPPPPRPRGRPALRIVRDDEAGE